ncbi:MAG: recD [Massilia sp.]|nr:recD [Massilia sp.]
MSVVTSGGMADFWREVALLTEQGALRRLSGAFARFVGAAETSRADRAVADQRPLMLACVLLSELEGRGHSCLMVDQLAHDPCALMGWTREQWAPLAAAAAPLPKNAKSWLALLGAAGQVWQAGELDYDQPLVLDGERLYLRRYWRDETVVAAAIGTRARQRRPLDAGQVHGWLAKLFGPGAGTDGPDWQRLACAIAVRGDVAIITGGPGTGKTYTVARLLALLLSGAADQPLRIALAAPTGKAAARLKQSIDKALQELAGRVEGEAGFDLRARTALIGPARTLHSLLGARPDTRHFAHHRANPLDVDVLIVDEASMVHLEMMAALLDALPPSATLVLLGDKDQLSSVEAGAVLGDLCQHAEQGGYDGETAQYALAASGQALPPQYLGAAGALAQQTVMLRHSHRFSGPIGALALAVNQGDAGAAEQVLRAGGSVGWIEHAQQGPLLQLAVDGYRAYLEVARDGGEPLAVLRAFEQFRLLCAVREGEWGVAGLNGAIEQRLEAARLIRKGAEWYAGRPVMVTRNDYGTRVYNGDIGVTLVDPGRPGSLRVYFLEGDQVRSVLATRLRHVETAFAMTVHKSQGSEFSHTVMVLPKAGGAMLARELIYTGITRARERFTLVTPNGAVLAEAIARKTQRASGLRAMLARI